MITVQFLRPAEIEMAEAAVYYETQAEGLGNVFLETVERVMNEVVHNPKAWPVIHRNIRKRVVSQFPYSVLYRVDPDEIVVVAVMRQHRHPDYWLGRI